MLSGRVRAGSAWLTLREPADAAARSEELVEEVRAILPTGKRITVHDLGCGTGSMARWLAPRLPGRQHWVLHDRDAELLALAAAAPPSAASDGAPVTAEPRPDDVTRLDPDELADASLITASALLDMLTAEELDRLVAGCSRAGCPVLITLSVMGQVGLTPPDPIDQVVADAFNAHQRRITTTGPLLGPDAVEAAVAGFTGRGADVLVRPSPWRLGADQAALVTEWFTGWLAAAREQEPRLSAASRPYARRRLAEAAHGRLSVTVHHQDLLVRPR